MYTELKDKILLTGTSKINYEYTRQDSQPGGRLSCLDHVYMNHPQKVNSLTTHHNTFSDHALVKVNIAAKKVQNEVKFLKIRSLKNFSPATYVENIHNHDKYMETMYEIDTDIIAKNITQILQESANPITPVIRVQLSSKNINPLSMEARQALVLS